ncbi:hypothetical protein NIA69_08115 [Gemmiger formicilis]|nr:hypothetical protein [Gemmiger formicilis]
MFLFTVTKPGLRQAGALALCAVCLCGTVAAAVHFSGGAVTASAAAVPGIETTQDIGTYFTGYGFDTDLASAAVDKVKIPKSGTTALPPSTRSCRKAALTWPITRARPWKSGLCSARSSLRATMTPTVCCWSTRLRP